MPISEERWQLRAAAYQRQQPVVTRAKERYDKRLDMLNNLDARDKYRDERWATLGKTFQAGSPRNDPIRDVTDPSVLAGLFKQTLPPERLDEIDEGFNDEYAGYVRQQETKEFMTRRAAVAQGAFDQHKMLHPEASDQEAYNAMHRQLVEYGFQPRGLETLVPFRLKDGRPEQSDYTPVWSEAESLLLGVVRGARRLATSPFELANAGLELTSDIYNRNQAGAGVTGSNVFRDTRRSFAIQMGAVEQVLASDDMPYNFDVAGTVGEQIPNMLATMTGAKMISTGAKFAGNALALGSMFAAEGTDAYNNYMQYGEQQGLDPRLTTSRAFAGAMAYGAASAALERLIPVETLRRAPGIKNRVTAWALGSLAEGSTEFLQSLTQSGIGKGIDLGQFDWDSIRTATREAAAGVIVGGAAGATALGRVTPQVDRLDSAVGPIKLQTAAETEIDVVKKRAEILDEVTPSVVTDGAEVGEIAAVPINAEIQPQPGSDIQTRPNAIDRVVSEATGLRSKLRKGWRTLIDVPAQALRKIPAESVPGRLRDTIGRGLSDTYGRPVEWIQGQRKAKGRERLAQFTAESMGRQWTKQLTDAGLDPTSSELQAVAEMGLRGDVDLATLPPVMQAWVQTARTLMDTESLYAARVYRAAGLDVKADEFEKNIGSYLKNIPLANVTTIGRMKNALRTSAAFGKVKRDAWLVWDGKKLLGKFEVEAEARELYKATLARRKSQVIKKRAAEKGVTSDDINRQAAKGVKIEAPISKEWRQKYEVHNPAYLLARSMIEARHDAEMVQLFNTVAEKWGYEVPEGVTGSDIDAWAEEAGLVQLPQSGRLHNLKGVYVPKIIAKDLTDMTRLPSAMEQAYVAYLSAWKSSKTLFNPATHARNIYGNVLCFSYLAQCSALNPLNAKFYRKAATSLSTKDAAFVALVENGALGGEYYGGEIERVEQVLAGAEDSKIGQVLAGIEVVQQKLGQTYAVEDQIFKLAAYHKYTAEGMSPETASEEVNKWFPNYERTGKVTRWLRNSPVGAPFISFVDQSVRIAGRGVAERPFRVAAIAAMPGILQYMSAIALGLNPDEKELIDAEKGYFEPLVPWRDEKGRTQTMDLRYIFPLANDIVPEERRGGVMVPWILSGPAATTAIEQASGKERFTGKEFIREGMTFKERVLARGATIARASLPHPSIAYWGAKRIAGSITGDRNEHVANAIIGSLLGLNVQSPYVTEKHVKQVVQNMVDGGDWREAEILLDVWNERYKPDYLKRMTSKTVARGLQLTKLAKWRKVRDNAAEAILQGREDDAQEIVDDYMAELEPGTRPLFMSGVEYRARQWRIEGKAR